MNQTDEPLPFERKVKEFITRNSLIRSDSPVIIGLSGGADSVALTMVLHRLGFACRAAHCNFHLRGEESDRDEHFVRQLTSSLDIELDTVHFDVKKYIAEAKRPTSLEMACRELRYDWFRELRHNFNAQAVAIAHNADDNIETVLLNMLRGTGITGLRGMLPLNNDSVIRPLLSVYRQEIEAYLEAIGVGFVTDSTNHESEFGRNKLRNKVLPILFSLFPDGKKGMTNTLSLMRQANEFYTGSINDRKSDIFLADTETDIEIDIRALRSMPNARLLLYEWLRPHGLSMEQIFEIIDGPMQSGNRFFCKNGYFLMDRGILTFVTSKNNNSDLPPFNHLFNIESHVGNKLDVDKSGMTAYFDSALIDENGLTYRFWKRGDRMKPFGMKGSKKLSDIFSDAKIPLNIKSRIPLLVDTNDEILWIPGLRASRTAQVSEKTTAYISIHYIGPKNFNTF